MKKVSFVTLIAVLCLICITTVSALGYSMYKTGTVNLSQGSSKTFGAYSSEGVNLRAQSNITSASYIDGYVKIQYSIKKCTLAGVICGNSSSVSINVGSSGWVGGNWTGVDPGSYKYTFKAVSGSFKANVRMYDY